VNTGKINLLAVIVAAIVYWLLGAAWFTVLSKPWLEGIGKSMEQLQRDAASPAIAYVVALVCNLVIAYVLAWLVIHTGEQTAMRGITMGAVMWVGLVATTFGTAYIFEGRSIQIFAISAGYPLVGMLLMGAIVGAWKAKA
jgi:hypothetical protein